MKKITLIIIACVISATALKAQMEQGKLFLGLNTSLNLSGTGSNIMSFGFSTERYKSDAEGFEEQDPDKTFGFNLLPKVGVFVIDNLAIGLDLVYYHSNYEDGSSDFKSKSNLFMGGPFVRYYIPTTLIRPFFEAGASYGVASSKYDSEWSDNDSKYSIMNIGGGVGMAIPIGKRASFDLMVDYNQLVIKDKDDNDDNERLVTGTIGLKLGFVILLGGE